MEGLIIPTEYTSKNTKCIKALEEANTVTEFKKALKEVKDFLKDKRGD